MIIGVNSAINYTFTSVRLWSASSCRGTSVVLSPGEASGNLGGAYWYLGSY
jgi:hypothetical protein